MKDTIQNRRYLIAILILESFFLLAHISISYAQTHSVVEISDVATMKLSDEKVVRLIGVEPFACRPDTEGKERCTAQESKEFLQQIFKHYPKEVTLEYDSIKTDKEGRLLGYAYIDTGFTKEDVLNMPVPGDYHFIYRGEKMVIFLNAAVIKNGFAKLVPQLRNTKYNAQLKDLYSDAKNNKRGLWAIFGSILEGDPCSNPGECQQVSCFAHEECANSPCQATCLFGLCQCYDYMPPVEFDKEQGLSGPL